MFRHPRTRRSMRQQHAAIDELTEQGFRPNRRLTRRLPNSYDDNPVGTFTKYPKRGKKDRTYYARRAH